jgi:hypothetical protein
MDRIRSGSSISQWWPASSRNPRPPRTLFVVWRPAAPRPWNLAGRSACPSAAPWGAALWEVRSNLPQGRIARMITTQAFPAMASKLGLPSPRPREAARFLWQVAIQKMGTHSETRPPDMILNVRSESRPAPQKGPYDVEVIPEDFMCQLGEMTYPQFQRGLYVRELRTLYAQNPIRTRLSRGLYVSP